MKRRVAAVKDDVRYKQTDISQYFKVKGKLGVNTSCTIMDKENSFQEIVELSSEAETNEIVELSSEAETDEIVELSSEAGTNATTEDSESEPITRQRRSARRLSSDSECEEEMQSETPKTESLPYRLPRYDDPSTYCSDLLATPTMNVLTPVKSNSKRKSQTSSDDDDDFEQTPTKYVKTNERHCRTPIKKKSKFCTAENNHGNCRKRLFQTNADMRQENESKEKGIINSSPTKPIPVRDASDLLKDLPTTSTGIYSKIGVEQNKIVMQKSKSLNPINSRDSSVNINSSKSVTPRKITVISDIKISNIFPNKALPSANLHTSDLAQRPSTSTKKAEKIKKTPSLSITNSSAVRNTKEEEWYPYALPIVESVVEFICKHEHLKTMLTKQESDTLIHFFIMPNEKYRSLCIKLFVQMQDWSNILHLVEAFHMNMHGEEIKNMYSYFSSSEFINTDFSSEPPEHMLKCLQLRDVKTICEKLKIKLTPDVKHCTSDMIGKLLMFCKDPSKKHNTLHASPEQKMLCEAIKEAMGMCVKLDPNFYSILHKVHMLYLVMTEIQSIKDLYYLKTKVEKKDEFLPKYRIDIDSQLFSSINEFSRFVEAYEGKQAVQEACVNRNYLRIVHLCTIAATQLEELLEKDQEAKPTYLKRFTAGNKYTETLSLGIPTIAKKYRTEAEEWLMLLLNQKQFCQEMRGEWYEQLVVVQYCHLQLYNKAVETLIKALEQNDLPDVARYALKNRAKAIKENRTHKITKLQSNMISFVEPKPIEEFRVVQISIQGFYSKNGEREKKSFKKYTEKAPSIHEEALKHYQQSFANWLHCESGLLITIFFILFWDIIYDSNVPAAFVSEIQSIPLDLKTEDFYTNREEAIKRRLEEIRSQWPTGQLDIFVCGTWKEHAHEKSLIIDEIVDTPKQLCDIIYCIGRLKVAAILERIAKDFSTYQFGIPDLFLWNASQKKCKFVHVKKNNGQLSPKHTLWLDFLRSIGADVEVCVVQTAIPKKYMKCDERTKKEEKKCLLSIKLAKSFLR